VTKKPVLKMKPALARKEPAAIGSTRKGAGATRGRTPKKAARRR
jgi:hypothetical protein